MKIGWLKAIGMASLLAAELSEASVDGRVTVDEALKMALDLSKAAGIAVDDKGFQLTEVVLTDIINAAADGKVTIVEIIAVAKDVCQLLGIPFDDLGVKV